MYKTRELMFKSLNKICQEQLIDVKRQDLSSALFNSRIHTLATTFFCCLWTSDMHLDTSSFSLLIARITWINICKTLGPVPMFAFHCCDKTPDVNRLILLQGFKGFGLRSSSSIPWILTEIEHHNFGGRWQRRLCTSW